MKNLAMVALLTLPLLGGCVSKGKYNALQDQYADLEKEKNRLSKRLERRKKRSEAAVKDYIELWQDLNKARNVGLFIENNRPVIQMKSDVLFASGSAELTDEGKQVVQQVARILSKRTDERYQVEGHTDTDRISTEKHPNNWYLGADRAITVAEAMMKSGMPKKRLSAATYAATVPAENKNQSRRIELVIMPDWEDLPGMTQVRKEIRKRIKEAGERSKSGAQ